MLILGLSMVVYFIYREIEQINKRVVNLENKNAPQVIESLNNVNKNFVLPLPLPPAPPKDSINIPISIDTYSNLPKNLNRNSNKNNEKLMGTVEEYSNEILIYSNDMINTNTNEQDTLMVESIVDMTKKVETTTDTDSDSDINDESDSNSDDPSETSSSDECSEHLSEDNSSSPLDNSKIIAKSSSTVVVKVDSPKKEDQPETQPENKPEDQHEDQPENKPEEPVVISANKTSNTIQRSELSKMKVIELQEMAVADKINIMIEGTNKKKTKAQLVEEIFNKKK